MTPEFWRERWAQRQIGFHKDAVHETLVAQAPTFLPGKHRVLVPLCGKTLDIGWLADQGHQVVGVELAAPAVAELIASLTPRFGPFQRETPGELVVWTAGPVTVIEGNFFAVDPAVYGGFDRCWDRAALVAVGPDLFERYAAHERALLRPDAEMLLQVLEYDQSIAPGPPWSVPAEMVRRLYAGAELREVAVGTDHRADRGEMVVRTWRVSGAGR